jgi:hypothetical protein
LEGPVDLGRGDGLDVGRELLPDESTYNPIGLVHGGPALHAARLGRRLRRAHDAPSGPGEIKVSGRFG